MSGAQPRSRWSFFRLSPEWARAVVEGAAVRPGDTVLDLGAGTGALTRALVDAGARVIALEAHAGRAHGLRREFAQADVTVVQADIRDLVLPARTFRVVSNPPFHLSRPIAARLIEARLLLGADLVLRADTARNLAARYAGHPRYRVDVALGVPRRAFRPAPSVDARVLRIRRRSGRGRADRPRR